MRCGQVDEFTDEIIEARQKEVAQKLGYELTDHGLYLYGICPKCNRL
jgi:Fur family ferric uptake transcriptional regulator